MASDGNERAADAAEAGRAEAGVRAELQARAGTPGAPEAPRVVTTGGKILDRSPAEPPLTSESVDLDTGEPVELYSSGDRIHVTRHLSPSERASPGVAHLDALALTVVPPEGESMRWVVEQLQRFLPIDEIEERAGCFGFKHSLRFGNGAGLVAWGGESQRGRVYFSIQGKGCSLVCAWPAVATWLESQRAVIKRVDVAYDDFTGQDVSIAWAESQYRAGGFKAGGREPRHSVFGDWLAGDGAVNGRTLGIGNRANGKYCRVYEKGKQLGDPASPWVRLEVEWRGKDRLIPYDILTRPGVYLAGAYPCLAHLDQEQSRIRTVAQSATIDFDTAIANGKQQAGRLVNLMLQVFGGDVGAVVERLRREGIPARIERYSYHLAGLPELLDPETPGSFAAIAKSR